MSVTPQTDVSIGKGRSSDFIPQKLLGLPEYFKVTSLADNTLNSVTLSVASEKGLTASGNVADSHCIPILAPAPHLFSVGGGEPFAPQR